MKKNLKLNRDSQNLSLDLVFIDGFSSSGKSLLCPIFNCIERCENWQIDYLYENLSIAYFFHQIKKEAVGTILNLRTDELIYNLFLSRNVNFRKTDQTSPYFYGNHKKYLERLNHLEGDTILNKINEIKPILPLHLHYIYGHTNILFEVMKKRLGLYIFMCRDPIYLINQWFQNNWTSRIGKDKRDFHLCFKFENKLMPWFTKDYHEEYHRANKVEKSVLSICYLYQKIIFNSYQANKFEKGKTIFIFFEDFIVYPEKYINKICKKLKTNKSSNFDSLMKKLNLPRKEKIIRSNFDNFYIDNKRSLSPRTIKLLEDTIIQYNKFYENYKLV